MVQWVRLRAPSAGAGVRSLVGELDPACRPQLRVHVPQRRSRVPQLRSQRSQNTYIHTYIHTYIFKKRRRRRKEIKRRRRIPGCKWVKGAALAECGSLLVLLLPPCPGLRAMWSFPGVSSMSTPEVLRPELLTHFAPRFCPASSIMSGTRKPLCEHLWNKRIHRNYAFCQHSSQSTFTGAFWAKRQLSPHFCALSQPDQSLWSWGYTQQV